MGEHKRNRLKIFGFVLIILLLGYFISHFIVKSKIESVLSTKLSETIKLTYSDIDVSLLNGKLELYDIKLTNFGKTIIKPNAEVNIKQLSINGISYWNYLLSDLIQIDEVYMNNSNIIYYHNPIIPKEEYQTSNKKNFRNRIEIKEFKIDEGQVKVIDSKTDSLKLQTQNIHLKLDDIVYSEDTKNRKIPIEFGTYEVFFDSFFAQLGEYEDITIQHASMNNEAMDLKNLRVYTKYSKETLSQIIPFERDHYNLEIDSIMVKQPQIGVLKDTVFKFESEKATFFQPDFKVYRDKLVTDDVCIKPLYSKMLRNLKMALNIENVLIHDADITYSEKVKADKEAGTITFSKLNADIKHLSNTYQSPTKTEVDIQSQFMGHAPLQVVWTFDVNNKTDLFEFQAEIDNLHASYMNQFMEPNLNILLEGELYKTYFTISGTDNTSNIDFKIKYDAFDVNILKDGGKDKKELLSKVVNIFISKDSESSKKTFKEASRHDIARHKTKSVFNFIWISARAGLIKAMIID